MTKTVLILALLFAFNIESLHAQSTFYGKKLFIEFDGLLSRPLLQNRGEKENFFWKTSGDNLEQRGDKINAGFSASFIYATRRKLSPGLIASVYYANAAGPRNYYDDQGNFYYLEKHEQMDLTSITIMPTINYFSDKFIGPAGLGHEFGLGYSFSSLKDKEYVFDAGDNYENQQLHELADSGFKFIDNSTKFRAVKLMYGIKVRTPISKSVWLNYGFRYTLVFGNYEDHSVITANGYYNGYDFYLRVRRALNLNPVVFNAGVTIAL